MYYLVYLVVFYVVYFDVFYMIKSLEMDSLGVLSATVGVTLLHYFKKFHN